MQDLLNVGIDSIGFYAPRFYIELEELAKARKVSPNKYKEGLLLKELRFTDIGEDIISLGFHAARIALQRGNINSQEIDGVFVGTETETYAAKSISNIFTELLDIPPNCLTQDIMNTCASGTLAILDAISLVELRIVTKALVIITDISNYEKHSAGEPTQGAGAVALVISKNPRIASFSRSFGKVSGNVDDFFRPKGNKNAQVFGKYSVQSYLNLQMKAYENLENQIGDINADYFIFHGPYARLPLKLMYKLISKNWLYRIEKKISKYTPFPNSDILDRIFSNVSIVPDFIVNKLAEITANSEEFESIKMRLRDVIKNTVLPQLHIPMYFGNMYSASLWAQLQYLLETALKPNDYVYFGSYGSGATCISGLIKINERYSEVIRNPPTVRDIMTNKVKKSIPEYEEIKYNQLKPELVWAKIQSLEDHPGYTLRYCDKGCLLSPIQGIEYCPKGHSGINTLYFPIYATLITIIKPFDQNDLSPLKDGLVLLIGKPHIGSTLEFELRRTQSNEEGSEAKGLLNWIPIYNANI
ncbi:MAG: hydroxymethylglutaryl-CoA synthase family protein [Candidatus Lokiarchaeota archaeon]|nr:hydroxymethylglutaryl-CoA synthase family protein [Candidatus Lokiarchaeota archaeon]